MVQPAGIARGCFTMPVPPAGILRLSQRGLVVSGFQKASPRFLTGSSESGRTAERAVAPKTSLETTGVQIKCLQWIIVPHDSFVLIDDPKMKALALKCSPGYRLMAIRFQCRAQNDKPMNTVYLANWNRCLAKALIGGLLTQIPFAE